MKETVLDGIRKVLNQIENLLSSFESLGSVSYEPHQENISTVQVCVNKTNFVYMWAQKNGSFASTNHGSEYADVMARWSTVIDDTHWALFGYENDFTCEESNRLKLIHLKLENIKCKLEDFLPSRC